MKRAVLIACPRRQDFREAMGLCETAGLEVSRVLPLCRKPHPATYIGPSRIDRIKEMDDVDVVVVYGNPKPSQIYKIMRETKKEVWDRTTLILKIFEMHAGSKEAKLQIELAKLKYELSMAREYIKTVKKGEQVFFLGPGEYAVEYVVRAIHKRMKNIQRELDRIKKMREHQKRRRVERLGIPEVAITGYTCAGKTALLNALAKLNLKEGAEMFTTITPKHARVTVDGSEAIFVDTVGFIESVPPQIIDAFHATLSEIVYSDAVVLVVDASDDKKVMIDKMLSSLEILGNIGASGKPLIVALNKVDVVDDLEEKLGEASDVMSEIYPWSYEVLPISAKTGYNLDKLVVTTVNMISKNKREK